MDSDTLKTLLNEIKDEIMKEISSLRETTVKQHNDLKSDFLAFKTSVLTQVNALDGALKKTVTNQEIHSKQFAELTKSQEFISSTFEERKKYLAANVSNIIKTNKNLEKENQILNQKLNEVITTTNTNAQNIINQEQYTRREMVEVNGIPQTAEENVSKLVFQMMILMKLDLNKNTTPIIRQRRFSDNNSPAELQERLFIVIDRV